MVLAFCSTLLPNHHSVGSLEHILEHSVGFYYLSKHLSPLQHSVIKSSIIGGRQEPSIQTWKIRKFLDCFSLPANQCVTLFNCLALRSSSGHITVHRRCSHHLSTGKERSLQLTAQSCFQHQTLSARTRRAHVKESCLPSCIN